MANKKRLEKLLKHMKSENVAHPVFDFNTYNANAFSDENNNLYPKEEFKVRNCQTNGCMLGELPAIWPKNFGWDLSGIIEFKSEELRGSKIAQDWFDLDTQEAYHLFMPNEQIPKEYGGKYLDIHATKEEVIENLEIFIARLK